MTSALMSRTELGTYMMKELSAEGEERRTLQVRNAEFGVRSGKQKSKIEWQMENKKN
jgi:hypothetical protein